MIEHLNTSNNRHSNYLLCDQLSKNVNKYFKMVTVKQQFILMQCSGHIIAIK